ncbi:hypothetical protein E4V99_16305 [Microbacterium sp. dk485]|uniref:hypothetical protein n=1 Tax=Microbacterium sp. dk485 TaxID=2560021 RepID=UPI001073F2F9|nr:hypothetical protein [Microbacterium sp. dk485]TFV82456.1 hypothetical protein E4V99_16305 [Microbacterium sp. dk485]
MTIRSVELGIPYTGWPVRSDGDYEFGLTFLDPALVEQIMEWAKEFNREFDDETGWRSEKARTEHLAEGRRLQAALQHEVGNTFRVELDPLGSGLTPL